MPTPLTDVCKDSVDHFPEHKGKQQRCRHCKTGYSSVMCSKCEVFLCLVKSDMVKCELRAANASCELLMLCELRVALTVQVTSCELHLLCELRVERKVRVGNSKVRVETKSASCLFSFVERPFSSNKKGILKSHFNLQLFLGFRQ